MTPGREIGRLHVITDIHIQNRFGHEALARFAATGGADVIQVRDKEADPVALIEVTRHIRRACPDVTVIVDDRVEVALEAEADGVHLGKGDTTVAEARDTGPDLIIGATAGNLEQALAAAVAGADYIGFGHIYPTKTKSKSSPPVGLAAPEETCRKIQIPVIAIGGIRAENVTAVLEAGAWGVAVIRAVCAAPDPEAATRELRARVDQSAG